MQAGEMVVVGTNDAAHIEAIMIRQGYAIEVFIPIQETKDTEKMKYRIKFFREGGEQK